MILQSPIGKEGMTMYVQEKWIFLRFEFFWGGFFFGDFMVRKQKKALCGGSI